MNVANMKPIPGLTYLRTLFRLILCQLLIALLQPVIRGDLDPFCKSGIRMNHLCDRADTRIGFHGQDDFMNHLAGGRRYDATVRLTRHVV
jgi:hypothetical protein